jgi:NADH-quinone oxidoreductase subunit C
MKEKLKEFFENNFSGALLRDDDFRGELSFFIRKEFVLDICKALFDDRELEVRFLSDICALDWLGQPEEEEGRFEVIYNLYSIKNKYRFFLRVKLSGDNPDVDSITSIWQSANWLEREVYDLMGVNFLGHPDLRKILTPDELEGHPLRKDFPLTYEMPRFSQNKNEPPEVIT